MGTPGALMTQRLAAIVISERPPGRTAGRFRNRGWRSGLNWYYSTTLRI